MCLLRGNPGLLPNDIRFVVLTFMANVAVTMLCVSLLPDTGETRWSSAQYFTAVCIQHAVSAALIFATLSSRGHASRFPATMSAIFGCDILLTVIATALFGGYFSIIGAEPSEAITITLLLWSVLVNGNVLARALAMPLLVGVVVAFATLLVAASTGQIVVNR